MIKPATNGGGNLVSGLTPIIVRRNAAIGDVVSATAVAERLDKMGFAVCFQAHPDTHCVLRRHPKISRIEIPNGFTHVNLDGAYERDPARRRKHFTQMFFERANEQLLPRGIDLGAPTNCRPRLIIPFAERQAGLQKLSPHPKPWVFVCPRSNSYAARQVPDGIWQEAARHILGTKFWIGTHPAPPGFVDLQVRHLDNLIVWLSAADLLVTVDTGPLHLAAAMGIPILALGQSSSPDLHLSDQADYLTIEPAGLTCLNCQQNVCPINQFTPPCQKFDPNQIAFWANTRLHQLDPRTVSAVIATYRAQPHKLNHCIEAILPQVDEVIVCRDATGQFPPGALQHPKVRYLVKDQPRIGYGRNANYGARNSNGHWIVFLNDDAYLNPGGVEKMLEAARAHPKTGIVVPLLRYPDGSIYHAGKVRAPRVRGWGHIDHRKFEPTFKDVTWQENACLCVGLIKRQAFYDAQAWDEDFFVYAEDDSLCLAVRRAGYEIYFTPHASGIHDEGQSTRQIGDIIDVMKRSNALFDRKWGDYLTANADKVPGDFTYLTK